MAGGLHLDQGLQIRAQSASGKSGAHAYGLRVCVLGEAVLLHALITVAGIGLE